MVFSEVVELILSTSSPLILAFHADIEVVAVEWVVRRLDRKQKF